MIWVIEHRAGIIKCWLKLTEGIGCGIKGGESLKRAELKKQMALQGQALAAIRKPDIWGERAQKDARTAPLKIGILFACIWQNLCCPLVPSKWRSETNCAMPQKKKKHHEKDKYLSPGPVPPSPLDLFLNKAGLIKVVSLAVRVLPLILEFPG